MWSSLSTPLSSSPTLFLPRHQTHTNTITNHLKKNSTATCSTPLLYSYGGSQHCFRKPTLSVKCSLSEGAAADNFPSNDYEQLEKDKGFWRKWKVNSAEMSAKLAKLGLAALPALLEKWATRTSYKDTVLLRCPSNLKRRS